MSKSKNYIKLLIFIALLFFNKSYAQVVNCGSNNEETPALKYNDGDEIASYLYTTSSLGSLSYFQSGGVLEFITQLECCVSCNDWLRGIVTTPTGSGCDVGVLMLQESTTGGGGVGSVGGYKDAFGRLTFNQGYVGRFTIEIQEKTRNGVGFCSEHEWHLKESKEFCKKAPSTQFVGNVQSQNGDLLLMAGSSLAIPFTWTDNFSGGYCGNIQSLASRITSGPAGYDPEWHWGPAFTSSSNSVYYGHTHTVYKTGTYTFQFLTIDEEGSLNYFDDVTIEVAPSCHDDIDPEVKYDVDVYGTGVQEVNGGYGQLYGGYRVEKNTPFTIDFGKEVTDFQGHYTFTVDANGSHYDMNPLGDDKYEFIMEKDIGSYNITVTKRDHLGNYCRTFHPVNIFVGGQDMIVSSPCLITLPEDIPELFDIEGGTPLESYIMQHFTNVVYSNQGIIVNPGVILEAGAQLFIDDEWRPAEEELVDNDRNWVQTMAYDDRRELIAESKSFFDNNGGLLQSQHKNLSDKYVMAGQPLYDRYGRATVSSLPAPVRASMATADIIACEGKVQTGRDLIFLYEPKFVQDASASAYRHTHFDGAKLGHPDPVGSGTPYTLGWYYSDNNTLEPYVPATSYPYSQTEFYDDGTGEAKLAAPPGNVYRGASAHQHVAIAGQPQPVSAGDAEIAGYLSMYDLVFPNDSRPVHLHERAYMVTNTDAHGVQGTTYYSSKGHPLVTFHANTYRTWNFYDEAGRLKVSVSPNGVQAFLAGTDYNDIDKTVYNYNAQGRVLSLTETDAGTTSYRYRRDGSLRFSQNALQAVTGKYSYTSYDKAGRVTESGEYDPGGTGTAFTAITPAMLESTAADGGLTGGTKSQQVYTYYDGQDGTAAPATFDRSFVRGKVSSTRKEGVSTTWYSYDERGRVTGLLMYYDGLGQYKQLAYKYHANGNVQEVAYQEGQPDAFYHVYEYDKDIRLKKVHTTKDEPEYVNGELANGTQRAEYEYYLHGPLKRVKLGEVQGVDYVYTPEGWLKSINHPDAARDPGSDDGLGDVAPDAFGMALDYYDGDYSRTGTGIGSLAYDAAQHPPSYNGNIRGASWQQAKLGAAALGAYAYKYDDKYQLTDATFGAPDFTTTAFTPSLTNDYKESGLSYDHNGNLLSLARNQAGGTILDNFGYNYTANTNMLTGVIGYGAYTYDAIGQMTDRTLTATGVNEYYAYDVRGNVTGIYSDINLTAPEVTFAYDDKGNRIHKKNWADNTNTWYVHDAQGTLLSVYDDKGGSPGLTETPLYGAGRIGVHHHGSSLAQYEINDHLGNVRATVSEDYIGGDIAVNSSVIADLSKWQSIGAADVALGEGIVVTAVQDEGASHTFTTEPGKEYNVRLLIYNRYLAHHIAVRVYDGTSTATLLHLSADMVPASSDFPFNFSFTAASAQANIRIVNDYPTSDPAIFFIKSVLISQPKIAETLNYADYYPFGQKMPGRNASTSLNYRFEYQGQFAEKDEETGFNNFELRQWDNKIGRWMKPDPYKQNWSPYMGMANNPNMFVDPDGGFETKLGAWLYSVFNGGQLSYNDAGYWQVNSTFTETIDGVNYTGISIATERARINNPLSNSAAPPLFKYAGNQLKYPGALIIETSFMNGGAFTLPPFVITAPGRGQNHSLMRHEHGHILQYVQLTAMTKSPLLGYGAYLLGIGVPSLISASEANTNMNHVHQQTYTEKWANQLRYWGELNPEDWNHSSYPVFWK